MCHSDVNICSQISENNINKHIIDTVLPIKVAYKNETNIFLKIKNKFIQRNRNIHQKKT